MPVHLRNFYFREHASFVKKQNEEVKKAQNKSKPPTIPRRFNPKK
jgi:hypothetical protein|tara:strand:+ start:428 stop:562 length:135 start_codon:yes stop_codon:yes gene_type:complete